jgi:ubiquinone/menaquinone biosynthesis C-methylase UbiE
MEIPLSESEKLLLDAIRSLELYPQADEEEADEHIVKGEILPSNPENLRKRGKRIHESVFGKETEFPDWMNAFGSLCEQGLIQQDGNEYLLTDLGRSHANRVRRERVGKRFSDTLIRCEQSKAYSSFCERVFGRDLCQANMVDMVQLEEMLDALNLTAENRVLDMGCGIGRIAEYISDSTHASVLGIDIATEAVKRAQSRTQTKKYRLRFQEGDLNDLSLSPASVDTIIAIATLHYAENLEATIGKMKAILIPHGQMGLFSFQYCLDNEPPDILLPQNTRLAQALKKHGLQFQTWDFTEREKETLRQQIRVATELMEEFRAEDNLDLCEDRIEESEIDLQRLETGKKRVYLYHVQLP